MATEDQISDYPASSTRRKRKKKRPLLLIVIVALLLCVISYFSYDKIVLEADRQSPTPISSSEEENQLQYISLENTDPNKLKAVIIINKEPVDVNTIARDFYGDEQYWPYILQENFENIGNILDIRRETIVRIPKIDSLLLLPDKGAAVTAKLREQLLTKVANKNKEKISIPEAGK